MITCSRVVVIYVNSWVTFDWVLVLALLVAHTDGDVVAVGSIERRVSTLSSDALATLSRKISLSIESRKLWFILNKIILAVLKNSSLVAEPSKSCHSFTFGLSVFVCILHLFVSLFHVAWADWLYLLMKRTTQNILYVFNVQSSSTASLAMWRMTLVIIVCYKASDEILIKLLVMLRVMVSSALVVILLCKFLVSKIETGTISHMHFETTGGKTLCLLFIDSIYLLFWVANWAVMFLRILLN